MGPPQAKTPPVGSDRDFFGSEILGRLASKSAEFCWLKQAGSMSYHLHGLESELNAWHEIEAVFGHARLVPRGMRIA
jgi:hypothetical protein